VTSPNWSASWSALSSPSAPPGLAAVASADDTPGREQQPWMLVGRWADRARDEVRRRLTGDA
jgi:hypothetical protein